MTCARTLFLENASPANRARVLSVFSLGIFGAGPIASLLAGGLARAFGTHAALGIEGSSSLAILAIASVTTRLRALR
jgi:hypothetical protein